MARFYNPSSGAGGDVSFTGEGCIVFPNDGEICNVPNSSGDGYGYSTIQITPDINTNDDRYIIIDPTAPNHIHLRAGGTQDASNSDIFLGGERNHIRVSDGGRTVSISVRPDLIVNSYVNVNPTSNANFIADIPVNIYVGDTVFRPIEGDSFIVDSVTSDSPSAGLTTITAFGATFTTGNTYVFNREEPWDYSWAFDSNGMLTGPAMGLLAVNGLYGNTGYDLGIYSTYKVALSGDNGEFLNDSSVPSNQIATIGDIANTVSSVTSYNPIWSGTGLAYTGTPAVGSYVRIGDVVTVQIDVTLANVTDFGTGQYSLTLPFNSRYHTDVYGGSVHKIVGPTTNHHSLKGHLSPAGNVVSIWDLGAAAQDEQFDHNSPVILTTADRFHMSFTYICE